jgi:hypothetical protein
MTLFESFSSRCTPNEFLNMTRNGAPYFRLDGFEDVFVVDRLVAESDWGTIAPLAEGSPRIVFFSIKGGVGRSTAMAATAWRLAQEGKRVMVLDLDLESPGLSSSLLPDERKPKYGITDWLVEDIVDNGETVFDSMIATSELSHDGEILVIPAHGGDPGEYVAKLGRIWMSKPNENEKRELWPGRLNRLLQNLERRWNPDVVLIDSRAGIDEAASACVTSLGAKGIMLFAADSEQTWTGYEILFRHWRQTEVVAEIRERLQLVGAMMPEFEEEKYFGGFLERAWDIFTRNFYDEVPAGEIAGERFNYDKNEYDAPHFPWKVKWNRSFAALPSIHARLKQIDVNEVTNVWGPLLEGVGRILEPEVRSE